jgi:hypothetical protein
MDPPDLHIEEYPLLSTGEISNAFELAVVEGEASRSTTPADRFF